MKIIGVISLAGVVLFAGCASAPSLRANAVLPADVRSMPERYVVVTVRNDIAASPVGVASTPRGYNGMGPYTVGSQARAQARSIAASHHMQEVAAWPIAVLGVHCMVYRIGLQADRQAVVADLKRDPRVESVQELGSFATHATGYNDTYAGLQRNLEQLAVPQAHLESRGAGVRVAVVDTGVDTAHVDLKGRTAQSQNFVDRDAAQFLRDRHGTAVAGVIGALANNHVGIVGIAPEVRLLAFKACWETNAQGAAACNTFTLAQALAAAIEARADIVNLSLAGPSDPLLTRIVRSGQRAGVIFVGAAPPQGAGFPVEVDGVIGVQSSGAVRLDSAWLAAPGEDIFTLSPADRYDAASGSSLATAEVSAVIALLKAQRRGLNAEQAQQLLARTSTQTGIDACAAMATLARQLSCTGASGVSGDSGAVVATAPAIRAAGRNRP